MGQNLGHGNFHPEQYMGAAAAMAHIPPGAFPQGVTNGDPRGFKGFKDEREEIRSGKFFSFFLVSAARNSRVICIKSMNLITIFLVCCTSLFLELRFEMLIDV